MTDSRTEPLDLSDPSADPFEVAAAAARVIADRSGSAHHDVALVLGSGWGQTGDLMGRTVATIDNTDVPGFAKAAVAGHSGVIRSVVIGDTDRRALVFGTRTHLYEGRGVRAVVHAVRTAAAAGCRTVVLTNGCGGINPAWAPGTPVLIRDHINLTAASRDRPLVAIEVKAGTDASNIHNRIGEAEKSHLKARARNTGQAVRGFSR